MIRPQKITKLLTRDQYNYLQKCRRIASELTGEEFIAAASEPWLREKSPLGEIQAQLDGYCDKLKLALELDIQCPYQLPPALSHLYLDGFTYMLFLDFVRGRIAELCAARGVIIIRVPQILPDDELRQEIIRQLHSFTRVRWFVGCPRM